MRQPSRDGGLPCETLFEQRLNEDVLIVEEQHLRPMITHSAAFSRFQAVPAVKRKLPLIVRHLSILRGPYLRLIPAPRAKLPSIDASHSLS